MDSGLLFVADLFVLFVISTKLSATDQINNQRLIVSENKLSYSAASDFCQSQFKGRLANFDDLLNNKDLEKEIDQKKVCLSDTSSECSFFIDGREKSKQNDGDGNDSGDKTRPKPYYNSLRITRNKDAIKKSSVNVVFLNPKTPANFICQAQNIGRDCARNLSICHKDAQCLTFSQGSRCKCNFGLVGDGYSSCGGCNRRTPCDSSSYCSQVDGMCECRDGFFYASTFSTSTNTLCQDIDECSMMTCSVNSRCVNSVGSFECVCLRGYQKSGSTCVDIDECLTPIRSCNRNAACTNVQGSFLCSCNTGYTGSGRVCTDINECLISTHNCHQNATCSNIGGGFLCTCKPGYTGNGTWCTDVDECKTSTDNCHKNASCTNTVGSFSCHCGVGFGGNGTYCYATDCRGDITFCDIHATCETSNNVAECFCEFGYNGTGALCSDINECQRQYICHSNASCTNFGGSYACNCNSGFRGNGIFCEDIDECSDEINQCGKESVCTNFLGSFVCQCLPHQLALGRLCIDVRIIRGIGITGLICVIIVLVFIKKIVTAITHQARLPIKDHDYLSFFASDEFASSIDLKAKRKH